MMNFNELSVGDRVRVQYTTGERMRGGFLNGKITKIWTPQEHRLGIWQAQVDGHWCFHASDDLIEHEKPSLVQSSEGEAK